MCLAVPGKIVRIEGEYAIVDYGGLRKRASLMVLPNAKVGDIVMVHAGFAIAKVDEKEAERTSEALSMLKKALGNEQEV